MSSIKPPSSTSPSSTSPLSQTVLPNTTSNLTKTQLDDLNYELSNVNCNCPIDKSSSISGDWMQEKYKKMEYVNKVTALIHVMQS